MPGITKDKLPGEDFGVAFDRHVDLDDYTVNFVEIRETHSLAEMLRGLPGDQCRCPHWGVVIKGRLTADYGDRQEVFEAGSVFYMPPGHVPSAEAGSEFIQFSPRDALAETMAAIHANMQRKMQEA